MNELLDMFLTAQNEGKPIEKIVGKDIEKFSKLFCSSFSFKNRLLNAADALKYYFWYVFVRSALQMVYWFLDLFNDYSDHNILNRRMDIDLRVLIIDSVIMAILMFIAVTAFRKIMFKTKRFSMKTYDGVLSAVAGLGTVVLILAELIAVYGKNVELTDTPTVIVFAVSGAYLLVYYLLRGRKNKKDEEIEK